MAWWSWPLAQLVVWCCAGVLAVLWWLWLTRLRVDLPGPPTVPILGNIPEFREVPVKIRNARDLHREYGDLIRFYMGPLLVVIVLHPDDVQHVLLTSKMVDRTYFIRRVLRMFCGDGLLTLGGRPWKFHRKLINPTFHSELLEGFLEAFHEGGLYLCERLANTGGTATEIYNPALKAAMRNIYDTVIGINHDLLLPDEMSEDEMAGAMSDAMISITSILTRPWLHSKFLLKMTAKGRNVFKITRMLEDATMNFITMRSATTEEGFTSKRQNLVESLIKPGGQPVMPLSEIRDEIMNLALAGTETTAVTMGFVLALLALHPEWQDAAQQELREVFGQGGDFLRAASSAELGCLKVLESIIKETLRLFPAVPMMFRDATKDLWLSRLGVLVPKGTTLAFMPCITHRLPEFFQDPQKFDPSRFLENHGGKEHVCSYIPFGVGARNCVGSQYARLQLKVFLSNVLRRFRILPHSCREDLEECILTVSHQPVKPIKVSCVPLHENSI
ncbi:cytochrome P450 4C1-like isoform X1 [Schistocerca gregaria]|uniref:cytochrome P450 4C1-like isoform X1 n=1 Tax=Schistocerca gregaria TaxID=7010 RepID=UPI00211DC12B|nr:cytochrome P450 4C1-like isoform X1 [Schistocerca gregaria]